jgi:transcriptional regulator of arginine metabolism
MLTDHHREARRTAIVRLLRHTPVRRQQELVRLLKREGHAVTQSSISRDLRELGVLKHSEGYVLPDDAEIASRTQDKFSAVAQFVREVRTAGASITVVKTTIGSAGSVAAAIDKAGWAEWREPSPATTRSSSRPPTPGRRPGCSSSCTVLLESE